jgi:ABC-type Fe3+/spermidine/putrescine transport system ATPase subunit
MALSGAGPPALECLGVTVAYDAEPVLRDLDLTVEADQVMVLLGPSGSGKTTLLSAVAGFVQPSAGEIRLRGRTVAAGCHGDPPERRDVGMVFQSYALWPHMTALETVAYPLRRRGLALAEAGRQALELLERMEIGRLADRRPAELSGGQQQRVGLARALARRAGLYLFDEPTAHLDAPLRGLFQEELAERRRATGAGALYATHDAAEALAVGDRVALIRQGRVIQTGSPVEVYERPADLWAARLTGSASLLEAQLTEQADGKATVVIGGVTVTVAQDGRHPPGPVGVLARPGWAAFGGPLPGTVRQVWYRGTHTEYSLATPSGSVVMQQSGPPSAATGDQVSWTLERGWVVDRGEAGS